jgi:hypothetical protein
MAAAAKSARLSAVAEIKSGKATVLKADKAFKVNANQRVLKPSVVDSVLVPVNQRQTVTQTIFVPEGTEEIVIRVVIGPPKVQMMRAVGSQGDVTEVP